MNQNFKFGFISDQVVHLDFIKMNESWIFSPELSSYLFFSTGDFSNIFKCIFSLIEDVCKGSIDNKDIKHKNLSLIYIIAIRVFDPILSILFEGLALGPLDCIFGGDKGLIIVFWAS